MTLLVAVEVLDGYIHRHCHHQHFSDGFHHFRLSSCIRVGLAHDEMFLVISQRVRGKDVHAPN